MRNNLKYKYHFRYIWAKLNRQVSLIFGQNCAAPVI